MTPLKDTLEIAPPSHEMPVTQATVSAPSVSGSLRSEALSLEIPVKIHGSRLKEAIRGVAQHPEPFEEQTTTMIVFSEGAVVRMFTSVNPGQMLVLTNLKTRQDAICRVAKVRMNVNSQGYVELEFTHRVSGYWGIPFPSDDSALSKTSSISLDLNSFENFGEQGTPVTPATLASEQNPAPKPVVPASGTVSKTQPAFTSPAPQATPSKPETTFISIGSQEDVQPAASTTVPSKSSFTFKRSTDNLPREASKSANVVNLPAISTPPPAVVPASPSTEDMVDLSQLVEEPAEGSVAPAPALPEVEDNTESVSTPVSERNVPELFGSFGESADLDSSRLGVTLIGSAGETSKPRQNSILIAACVAILFAGVLGGVFYYRAHSSKSGVANESSTPVSEPSNVSPATTSAAPVTESPATQVSASVSVKGASASASKSPAETKNLPAASSASASAKQAAPKITANIIANTLNAHPVSSQRSDIGQPGAAPSLDTAAIAPGANAALPGVIGSANMALPAPVSGNVGGQVKQARLISRVDPVYPAAALSSGIEGNVVVNAVIEKDGRVTQAKIVSGPMPLRQAALDALRQWKYEPSTLDGQAVAVSVSVTIAFHR